MQHDPAIADALRAAFGRDVPDAIEPLGGGRSGATLLKLVVDGRRYVLRRMLPASPVHDPRREIGCMQNAAELGVAPPVRYASAEQGVVIMDYVESVGLGAGLRSGAVTLADVARLLRTLHGGPAFPRVSSVADAVVTMLGALAQAGQAPAFANEFLDRTAEIRAALAPHATEASCHFDLNPSNILFDGTRLWLVDWELASLGDGYADLAALGVFSPTFALRRGELLAAYLGREPDAGERAHLELARALALVLYAVAFRALAARRGVAADLLAADTTDDLATTLARIEQRGTSILDEPAFVSVIANEARRACSGEAYEHALFALGA